MNRLFILIGRSGSGKTVVLKEMRKRFGNGLHEVVSFTTRPKRPGEKDGVDYNFLTEEEFKTKLTKKELIEHINYNNNSYGLEERAFDYSKDNIAIVEPQGLLQIISKLSDKFEIIVIKLDNHENVLENRMRNRGDSEEVITKRLKMDREKFKNIKFDHLTDSNFDVIEFIIRSYKGEDRMQMSTPVVS